MKSHLKSLLISLNFALLLFTAAAVFAPEMLSAAKDRYMCCQVDKEGKPYCCMNCGFLQCANKPVCSNDEHCGSIEVID